MQTFINAPDNWARNALDWWGVTPRPMKRLRGFNNSQDGRVMKRFRIEDIRADRDQYMPAIVPPTTSDDPMVVITSTGSRMPFLGFRNQYAGRSGRRPGTVRRLARSQRRKRLDGSSPSAIKYTAVTPLAVDAETLASGQSTYYFMVPALAPYLKEIQTNITRDADASGQQFFNISGFRHNWELTPNWTALTNAIAVTFEIHQFVTIKEQPWNEVITLPSASTLTESPAYLTTLKNDTSTGGLVDLRRDLKAASRVSPTSTFSSIEVCSRENSFYDSPNFLSKVRLLKSQTVYIPVDQTASITLFYNGMNISYRRLQIPIAYTTPTDAQTDAINTPLIPRGWPVTMIRCWQHSNSSTATTTQFAANDSITCISSSLYKVPDDYGRNLKTSSATLISL